MLEILIIFCLNQLLDQATSKLKLNGAARRMYTLDGSLILDVQDLITWCLEFYKKELLLMEPSKNWNNLGVFFNYLLNYFGMNKMNPSIQGNQKNHPKKTLMIKVI